MSTGPDRFTHLHVASAYSLRYGASTPDALVARAVEHGQSLLALTDRDGVYGAVRFALACRNAGITGVLGADLAIGANAQLVRTPTPARGGTWVDRNDPRAVFLARGARGWASLCRLVSAVHAGEAMVATFDDITTHRDELVVLLGPNSDVGRAIAHRRFAHAESLLRDWQARADRIAIELVSTLVPPGGGTYAPPNSTVLASRMLGFAREHGVPAVLTNAVRAAEKSSGRVVDVLDAVRRLVPLDERHRDQVNHEAYLKSGAQMAHIAEHVCRGVGEHPSRLLRDTRSLAQFCALDPMRDLGMGEVFVPEAEVVLPGEVRSADVVLRERCIAGLRARAMESSAALDRLDDELRTIRTLGFATYFLTVASVVELIRGEGIRVAARGSGAGSLVNFALGISLVDPIRHNLLMERFLSPLRRELPDIDIDVESARRLECYDLIIDRFSSERAACVSMIQTYRARHAIRDVGAALGLPPGEIDTFAKSFPHIAARNVRAAMEDLPELSRLGRAIRHGGPLLEMVEALDGLPRHVAMHPCGIVLSDVSLRDRTPIEASGDGYPMCQFDKDDVEELGLLKLDVLGIRMQSAMAHARDEIVRVTGEAVELDAIEFDDSATYELIRSTRTLGCFQIESPGQRELIGKFAPEEFGDIIIDISLFRPGPVKSDMVTPFLRARQGWADAEYIHDDLRPALAETCGVVVFHEQVLRIVATMTGCSLAEADETRRSLGTPEGQDDVRAWFIPTALRRGYALEVVEQAWEVLHAFASFGFCKAHAAAFAVPTYQSAWLKAHYPAFFYAGVLTHDPGMYPKRLILDDARNFDIPILGLDVNASKRDVVVELVGEQYGIRLALADVKGISEAELVSIVAGQPYASLTDFWQRAGATTPTIERLVLAGAFDAVHGLDPTRRTGMRGRLTRRDLLLHAADLATHTRAFRSDQGMLELGFISEEITATGLPEMDAAERVRAELDVLGLDVSTHVMEFYAPMLRDLEIVPARALLSSRSSAQVFVAGVKAATQTPAVRSGRRVVFATLDDSTGPIDVTFFEDAQVEYASTLFHSWLLLVRGQVRRTGPRGISLRATGCWELGEVFETWRAGGASAVNTLIGEFVPADEPIHRKVLVHASGFKVSPYADVRPPGKQSDRGTRTHLDRKLWHASPGSSGW